MGQTNAVFSANKRAELRCEVIGSRPPAKITWWKGAERLIASKQTVSQHGNMTYSSISLNVSVEDNGKQIYCKAENVEMKQSSIEDRITLNVFCAPESVHNCTVKNQSLNSLHLVCEPGDNGGLRQIFFLEVYNSNLQELQLNITSADVPEFLIRGLAANTKFTLNVYAANAKGRSASLSLTTTTLRVQQKQVNLYRYLKSSFNPAYNRHNQSTLSANLSMKEIAVPDVTYSELSLLPCHAMTALNDRRVLVKNDPFEYASTDFKMGKCAAREIGAFDELKHRESPVADGCSETEVSIETPLIESVRPGGRSHDIIIRRLSPSVQRTATPV
ncbi:sidestep protein-like protein [Dinothrombium tinctorium]|uniref:Sidestep protein-like protein n=1 Tax=Dinothrombium tinctorium TaxID=1965070 RepID=A0A3S3NW87_9ACAR|nr:sidestep protein-like protein [Dinothrombium tinctorium]